LVRIRNDRSLITTDESLAPLREALDVIVGCEMISRSALPSLAAALVVAAAPLAAIAQAPGMSVRADLGPTPRVKSGELDRAPPSGNPLWAVPIKDLSQTRDRPIFTPSRRPPPPRGREALHATASAAGCDEATAGAADLVTGRHHRRRQ
jgi:hypothetical protein